MLADPVGDLSQSSMSEIIDGPAIRAVRTSIIAGNPVLPCAGCTLASALSYREFAHDIRVWQGEAGAVTSKAEVTTAVWPELQGQPAYPVVIENSMLKGLEQGTVALIEGRHRGLHRVLFDVERTKVSQLSFRARPAGRRRLRLDLADDHAVMVGRASIALKRSPTVEVTLGCSLVTPWLLTTAGTMLMLFSKRQFMFHISI